MRRRTAIGFFVVGAAVLAAALVLRPVNDAPPAGAGRLVFPDIAATLPKAARVEITGAGKSATLVARDGAWGLAERDLYPIATARLREMLTGLAELRLIEPRTADRDQFARLGVDDPGAVGSTATALRVRDAQGALLADVILGHRRTRSQGGLPEAVYVRLPTENQSWLAEGRVPADSDPQAWLVREITDIPADKISRVAVTRGADTLVFERSGDRLGLTPPGEVKLDDYRVEELSRALTGLTLSDVRAGGLPGAALGQTVFTTADGLVMTVDVAKDGAALWARFTATGTGAEAWKRLAGWVFQLPDWREKALLPTLDDLKAAEPAK
jgi:hypothetical protein